MFASFPDDFSLVRVALFFWYFTAVNYFENRRLFDRARRTEVFLGSAVLKAWRQYGRWNEKILSVACSQVAASSALDHHADLWSHGNRRRHAPLVRVAVGRLVVRYFSVPKGFGLRSRPLGLFYRLHITEVSKVTPEHHPYTRNNPRQPHFGMLRPGHKRQSHFGKQIEYYKAWHKHYKPFGPTLHVKSHAYHITTTPRWNANKI